MAIFSGTKKEYNDFIGPRIRNVVQRITLNEKKKMNNTCAHCKENNVELESAHIRGKERKKIIEDILSKYEQGEQIIIDIEKVEKEIMEEHYPISENFIFLCRKCHKNYDSQEFKKESQNNITIPISPTVELNYDKRKEEVKKIDYSEEQNEVQKVQKKLHRWFTQKSQFNSKILYAYINLYEKNSKVTYDDLKKETNIKTFDSNFTQMKNFGIKNYGKIFEENGKYIVLWNKVEDIIWNLYKKYK
jgi:hypothetical protein